MIKRCSIIGFGSMGQKHALNARDLGLSVRYWDPSYNENFGEFERFNHEADALEWCDAVIIASPPQQHITNLKAAIRYGKPCLVEKPLSFNDADLEALIKIITRQNITISVGHNLRHHPSVDFGMKCITSGMLGDISSVVSIGASYLPNWRPSQNFKHNYAADPIAGGVLFDWVHEIDLLFYLFGELTPLSAFAQLNGPLKLGSDEQISITLLSYDRKILCNLLLSYLVNPQVRRTTIMGDAGVLELDIYRREAQLNKVDGSNIERVQFGGSHNDDYRNELATFLEAANGKTMPKCTLKEGLQVLRSVLEIRRLADLPSA